MQLGSGSGLAQGLAMDAADDSLKRKRRAKARLDNRTFKDGAIYLFRLTVYKKPQMFLPCEDASRQRLDFAEHSNHRRVCRLRDRLRPLSPIFDAGCLWSGSELQAGVSGDQGIHRRGVGHGSSDLRQETPASAFQ